MSEPRVIQADYANWRPVAGRKVLQLVFEVPIEQTADVMEKLGVPMPGESKWCAIALLESGTSANGRSGGSLRQTQKPSGVFDAATIPTGPEPSPTNANTAETGTSGTPAKERRPFASLPLSQQAAIRCQDNEFKLFLGASNAEDAADKVRKYCGVGSRSELARGTKPGGEWSRLEGEYQAYLTDRQYADARR